MTFLAINNSAEPSKTDTKKLQKKGNGTESEKNSLCGMSEVCIQTCAWILLTVGLCIIIVVFYLAIHQQNHDNVRSFDLDSRNEISIANVSIVHEDAAVVVNESGGGDDDDDDSDDNNSEDNLLRVNQDNEWLDSPRSSRMIIENVFGSISTNLIGCQEKLCKIACSNDKHIYTSLFATMKTTSCPSIDVLLMESQNFPDNILTNSWLPANLSVYEIILRSSNVTRIKGNSFNTPMFMGVFLMSWFDLELDTVESGALLGLFKLRYLTIDSKIKKLEPAFFQPVQTTLTHLKLNARLEMSGNRNLFDVGYMSKLEYLDLSYNNISGTLTRRMFQSTPNLKYLIMIDCKLEHIEEHAFRNLTNRLIFLNLAKNRLITLEAQIVEPILRNNVGAMVSLSRNEWRCDCDMEHLASLYREQRNKFIEDVYCTAPRILYGIPIDEVNYEEQGCDKFVTTEATIEEIEISPTIPLTTPKTTDSTPKMDFDASEDDNIDDSGEITKLFKMRCVNAESAESSVAEITASAEVLERNLDAGDDNDIFQLPPPSHEFDLELIEENNTVIVLVKDPGDLVIMWFSEQEEADFVTCNGRTVDYECMRYAQPQLMVGPLVENTTYTFCLVPPYQNAISPFNCMPLHVPLKRQENIWISQDNKQFTIGMLCLIFLVSTIMGALVAYFGIKTYPDLLEGSKNVLVVKKPDKSCYVSTISETEYMKQNSLKKRKTYINNEKKDSLSKEVLRKKSSIKLPLPAIPPETPPPSFQMSVQNLPPSLISNSPYLDDPFSSDFICRDENYETPRSCENEYTLEQRSAPNNYAMSPASPPPLPKRNSNLSDTSTLVLQRSSKEM
ncbi:uncharacterized protein LOC133324150 [Musca vetustissima]|uniref:uncharacterized protein LOC133324150 n=1 Tax=Musca vetustissima TaxID=27455 RepID=UPI002AB737FF|nr:uncharacterized protein LOC133324150 [Musca vetustissima]